MASYFNPANERFKKIIRSDIYADKTGLLKFTNQIIGKDGNCIALSHARRFGKSQAADMLEAYYSCGCDSKTLFDGLEISDSDSFTEHLNQYNVIHLDIASCSDGHKKDLMESIRRRLFRDISMTLDIEVSDDADAAETIYDVYLKTARKFVIIIDEWDCVVRNYSDDPELVHEYLQFLHSLFKSSESQEFLALGYITGILPVKKIENESALNNFREYTMIRSRELTPYFGFTENEVFALCRKYNMDPESVKEWYNGYLIDGKHMYNPNSVVQAMLNHDLDSYWKNTSAFSTINKYITLNFEGLKDDVLTLLEGGMVQVNTERFQNDLSVINSKDDALTALIHLGYLGYDNERKKAYIPNYEVAIAFQADKRKKI